MNNSYPILEHSSFSGLIGVAECDITPPAGIYSRNWGAARRDVANGIHQDLALTCISFQSATTKEPMILISMDLGWWKNMEDEHFFRQPVLDALGIDPANLMICFSHTHSGPGICRSDAAKSGGEYIEPYLLQLQEKTIKTAQLAVKKAASSILTWQYGTCSLAANRDLPVKKENRIAVGFNPGEKADNTMLVGRITNENGEITGTIVNYACHPTTLAWGNALISPDYVGSMRRLIEDGTGAPCLFLQGASGDLAPAEQYSGDAQLAEKHGRQVGFSALATLYSMLPPQRILAFDEIVESGAPLAVWRQSASEVSSAFSAKIIDVPLPLKKLPSLAEIEQELEKCTDHVLKERLSRKLNVRKAVGDGKVALIPLWIWQLGDSFLIGQPNEAYSLFQTTLRQQFPERTLAVMNVVNGHIGYLPNKELYDENAYAVWQTPFAAGGLEKLISFATDTIGLMRDKK
jgi:hypothetical protein